jgi:predicted NBD/HSP70 family sugar kinase
VIEHASLGWRDVPVREILGRGVGLPVRVDSHARALACAEQLFGKVRVETSFLHVFVGNVVDAAIVTGGIPFRGPRSGAGEIAHLPVGESAVRCSRGHHGCFEATVSDQAWAQRAAAEGIIARPSPTALMNTARGGSERVRRLFSERARVIGRAVAVLFDLLNPEVLVVTEAGTLLFPECLDVLRAEIGRRSLVCADPTTSVVASSFGLDEVLGVAGAAVELDAIYRNPLSLGVAASSH